MTDDCTTTTTCPVCLERDATVLKLLFCGHAIHVACLSELSHHHSKCPLCRAYLGNLRDLRAYVDILSLKMYANSEDIDGLPSRLRKFIVKLIDLKEDVEKERGDYDIWRSYRDKIKVPEWSRKRVLTTLWNTFETSSLPQSFAQNDATEIQELDEGCVEWCLKVAAKLMSTTKRPPPLTSRVVVDDDDEQIDPMFDVD